MHTAERTTLQQGGSILPAAQTTRSYQASKGGAKRGLVCICLESTNLT